MPSIEAHVFDITRVIQLAVAPVFLLTAIGTIINALTGRLARAVDRRRRLEEMLSAGAQAHREDILGELGILARRTRLVLWSIALAVLAALFVCLLIGASFIGAYVTVDFSRPVALLFIAAMVALTACLLLFLREVFLAAMTVRAATPAHGAGGERSQATAKEK